MIKYVGPVVIYKIIDAHNYLLMTPGGKILQGLFKHERLKPATIRNSEGNVTHLAKLKQIINAGIMLTPEMKLCYGINYKYEGMLAHSFDRFYVITKFVLPTLDVLKLYPTRYDKDCQYLRD